VYHPYEVGILGPEPWRTQVAMALGKNLRLDVVVVNPQTSDVHPVLGPLTFLEADGALVTLEAPGPFPFVSVIGPGGFAPGASPHTGARPLACVGPGAQAPHQTEGIPYFALDDAEGLAQAILAHWKDQTAQRPLLGLVLTGGKSQRMGLDKAAIGYPREEEARRVFRLLQGWCSEVFVSCRADQALLPGRAGLPQIHDILLGKGPVSGILSAFEARPDASWLVVACDLPRVDNEVIQTLLAHRNPWKVATAYRGYQDLPEPLCAVYEPKARPRLWQFLAAGIDCPRKMILNSSTTVLDPLPGNKLKNINHPGERMEVLRDLGQ